MANETRVKLKSNYFALEKAPEWKIYKYHVTFDPEVEMAGFRRALLAQHKSELGGYLFDGIQMFATSYHGDLLCLTSRSREEEDYHLQLKFTKSVDMASTEALQILNLINRCAIRELGLVLVGRNYFDEKAKVFQRRRFRVCCFYEL